MKLANHYRLIGIHEDSVIDDFICGGNSSEDSDCRVDGECEIIDFFHGMSDFAAYRSRIEKRDLISFVGTFDSSSETFIEDAAGSDTLSLITEYEYIAIHLNDTWIGGLNTPGLSGLKVLTLALNFELYEEHFGIEEEDDFPGVLWDVSDETEIIRPSDERFDKLRTLRWNYRHPSTASAELKKAILPAGKY
jgi:hypothetical protein